MSRLTLRTENQWPYVRDGGGIDLLRIPVSVNRWHVSVGVTLLGFGVGLTWWIRQPVPVESLGREHAP